MINLTYISYHPHHTNDSLVDDVVGMEDLIKYSILFGIEYLIDGLVGFVFILDLGHGLGGILVRESIIELLEVFVTDLLEDVCDERLEFDA